MNYSEHSHFSRVDFFRADENGRPRKWYTSEAVSFEGLYFLPLLLPDAFEAALRRHLTRDDGQLHLAGMIAFCGEPYHQYAHPIVLQVPNL